jgi:hypothetical protein
MRPVAVVALALTVSAAMAQGPAPLLVTRTDGAGPVVPGQTISFRVTSPARLSLSGALLISQGGIGMTIVPAIPDEVRVSIPKEIALRRYIFVALNGEHGSPLESEGLTVDVERPDVPVRLRSNTPGPVSFYGPSVGGLPLTLDGIFADGLALDVSESSRVVYRSSDPSVATFRSIYEIVPVAPGRATLSAIYTVGDQSLRVDVPVMVRVPALVPSQYAMDFGEQRVGASATQSVTLTNTLGDDLRLVEINAFGDYEQQNDCPPALSAAASCRVTVTFRPIQSGKRLGELQIGDGFTTLPYRIVLSGNGI